MRVNFFDTGIRNIARNLCMLLAAVLLGLPAAAQGGKDPDLLKLWFLHPAAHWNEALPVGNGSLGAMVFGGVSSERLQLNEKSVWTGRDADFVNPKAKAALPQVRKLLFAGRYAEAQQLAQETMMGDKKVWSTYQTLGDLELTFAGGGEVSGYRRELDLQNAVARVSYRQNNIQYLREVFASAPAQALVVRLTADKKGAQSFDLSLSRPGGKARVSIAGNEVVLSEHVNDGNGVKLVARVKVLADGGTLVEKEAALRVEGADAVTLVLTAATDYTGADPDAASLKSMEGVVGRNYEDLKKEHIQDFQQYFNRVSLDLGTTDAVHFPTDARLAAVQSGYTDPHLVQLYYQFGRYLLISSSRPGSRLPANLQGLWADGLTPPWSADYHININIQMNYWPAEVTNLSEMHKPFLDFINDLLPDGRKTARDMYGLEGAVAHFSTDAWHYTETYGETQWAMWPMGLAWSVHHLWEHYLFTGDREFLARQGYPAMKEAAEFCKNWLVVNPVTGKLVSGPSISPENTFRTRDGKVATMVMGPTMDHMIIRDLLTNTISAAKVLGRDARLQKELAAILRHLAPTQVGRDGRIMEWVEEFEEPEPGHRHISHLFGLHPGKEINRNTPELLEAARKTIEYRLAHGGGHTGWSRAWIINFFARLHDGEAAYKNLVALLQKSTLPNLFDNHPPFQIDGNFGAVAGITEMLLQSHAGEVELLPALPVEWKSGSVQGLVARGGYEVSMNWSGGELQEVTILSRLGGTCRVRYKDNAIEWPTEKGKIYVFNNQLAIK